MLSRRKFLAWLGGTAAGVAAAPFLDLDKLLWLPGEKTILIPAVEEFSSLNTFITPEWITKDVAKHFMNNLKLVGHFDRPWSEPFGPGARVTVRLPRKQEGASLSLAEPSITF